METQTLKLKPLNNKERHLFGKKISNQMNLKLKKYKESIYYGEIQNGKRNGTGIMLYNNGRLY